MYGRHSCSSWLLCTRAGTHAPLLLSAAPSSAPAACAMAGCDVTGCPRDLICGDQRNVCDARLGDTSASGKRRRRPARPSVPQPRFGCSDFVFLSFFVACVDGTTPGGKRGVSRLRSNFAAAEAGMPFSHL